MQVEVENFKTSLKEQTQANVVAIRSLLNGMVGDLQHTAEALKEYDDLWSPDAREVVRFSHNINSFDVTVVADTDGNAYDECGDEFSVADQEYFRKALEGEVVFSEVLPSKRYKGIQVVAFPLRTKDNEVKGVLLGLFDIQTISDLINSAVDYNEHIYIIDSNGYYVNCFHKKYRVPAHKNFWEDLESRSMADSDIAAMKKDFEERKEGDFSYTSGETQRYGYYMPIGTKNWQLVVTVEDTAMNSHIRSIYEINTQNEIYSTTCLVVMMLSIIWYFKQTNREILIAHQEATKNIEVMRIASKHSRHVIFEYDQAQRRIEIKTDTSNNVVPSQVLTSVPECFTAMDILADDSVAAFEKLFEEIRTQSSCEADIQLKGKNGMAWCRISMHNIYDDQNKIVDTVGVVEDINKQKKEEAITKRKLELQEALISNALLYAKVDLSTDRLLELNGEEIDTPFQDFLHKNILDKVSEEQHSYVGQELSLESLTEAYCQGKESMEIQFIMQHHNVSKWVSCVVYRNYASDSSKVILVITDIDEKKKKEILLREQAERDGLTGLYNAATTRSKVNEILASKHAAEGNQIFILLDLDNYKLINDTFGHSYGDQVLIDVAAILNTHFRSSDIVGRLGGDEFVILLCNVKSYKYAEHLTKELCELLHKTYSEGARQVTMSASVGVAVAPSDGNTFEELYKKSDTALYQIKKEGKNGYRRYQ